MGERSEGSAFASMRDHLGLVVAAVTTLAATLKAMVVASGDPRLAGYLVTEAGPTSILSYTVTSLVPMLLSFGILAALIAWLPWHTTRKQNYGLVTLVLLVGFFTVPVFAWLGLVATVLLIEIISATRMRSYRAKPLPERVVEAEQVLAKMWSPARLTKGVLAYLAVASLVTVSVSGTPWLPAESITPHGKKPFTGYVISDSDGRLVILRDIPRSLTALPSDTTQRAFCFPTLVGHWFWSGSPSAALQTREYDAPRCPK
ncbi:hypothetical protein ASD62_05740 [Phycicoccus sp. Root563]|uniref:hypothetical protein n=1 Tax=Phycicoccus sp. Root563 TaxID=1736562 RepID=UPI000702832A|nr:hypothetical protein [Phycicoccus sp. Root563]KQZ88878.1 hypothetical protein ASD62_05740 [Phycicoccus sp. Root563]